MRPARELKHLAIFFGHRLGLDNDSGRRREPDCTASAGAARVSSCLSFAGLLWFCLFLFGLLLRGLSSSLDHGLAFCLLDALLEGGHDVDRGLFLFYELGDLP